MVSSDNNAPYLRYTLWLVLTGAMLWYKLTYHELWKDEWQAYLVARDMSLGEMLGFLNYEGHPALWYLYLKVVSLFSGLFVPYEETLIQLGHTLLLSASLFMLFVKTRVSPLFTAALALSYFFGFQYGIVNRGYILVILLSLITVWQIQKKSTGLGLVLSLFLLCQTEVYGVFIAGVLLLYHILTRSDGSFLNKVAEAKKAVIGLAFGFIAFVATVYPRGNEDDFSRAYNGSNIDLDSILLAFQGNTTNAFLPGLILDTSSAGWSGLGLSLGVFVVGLLFLIFRRDRVALLCMTAMIGIMWLFGVLIYSGGIRQWGMVYVLFATVLLLSIYRTGRLDRIGIVAFAIISIAQIVHNGRALYRDATLPFSITEQVGAFVKEKVPAEVPIVVINKFETAAIGAYADRPLYELPSGSAFTYFKWLEKVYIPTQGELELFAKFKKVGGIVLVSPTPIDAGRFPKAQLWQSFEDPNYKMERMYLYSLPVR